MAEMSTSMMETDYTDPLPELGGKICLEVALDLVIQKTERCPPDSTNYQCRGGASVTKNARLIWKKLDHLQLIKGCFTCFQMAYDYRGKAL